MAQLRGNQAWKLRTTHGRDKLFSDAALLWDEACLYFEWCDRNPWYKPELVKYKGDYEEAETPLRRPYIMEALTNYLGVSVTYFATAKKQLREKLERPYLGEDAAQRKAVDTELLECYLRIEQTVRTQQIEGGLMGVFNSNLTARIAGIADTVNGNHTGEMVFKVTVRDQETADNLAALDDLL